MPDSITDRNSKGQFLTGSNGGPGRKRGSRNRIGEALLQTLADDYEEHGADVVRTVRQREPATYLKLIAGLLPREIISRAFSLDATMDISTVSDARQFLQAYRLVRDAPLEHIEEGIAVSEGWRHDDD